MAAINGSTTAQPDNLVAIRERTIAGLFPPIGEMIRAADAVDRAIQAHDLGRVERTNAMLRRRIADYIERVSS